MQQIIRWLENMIYNIETNEVSKDQILSSLKQLVSMLKGEMNNEK